MDNSKVQETKTEDKPKAPEVENKLLDERMRLDLLKRKIASVVGKLQNELVSGDARYKLRKELEALIEEI